jgi:actin-related protein 6
VYNDVHSLFGDEPQKGAGALPSVADCLLIIDSGFSHTTVTPLLNGHPLQDAVRRLDVGGKHLTNYLAELLAIHELSLKEDPWIANEVKEATCFVTESFREDMEKTWRSHQMDSTIVVDVQLPDYQDYFNVIVRPYDGAKDPLYKAKSSIITLGNEQFQVPELLFTPGDIGMLEGGLPELVMQSVGVLPEGLRPGMLANIMVVGGNVKLRGFMSRLYEPVTIHQNSHR